MTFATLALAAGLLISSGALASKEGTLETSKGRVLAWDTVRSTLLVKVENRTGTPTAVTFVLDDASKIIKGSSKVELTDIAHGDRVVVNYRIVGGKNLVLAIGVEPPA